MKSADYYRGYYAKTKPRRQQLARERKSRKYWTQWLLRELLRAWDHEQEEQHT